MPRIKVLRLEYRPHSDRRISTHLALVSRAFGASQLLIAGEKRLVAAGRHELLLKEIDRLKKSIGEICNIWGGDSFQIDYVSNWKTFISKERENGIKIVHLTIYGLPITEQLEIIRELQKQHLSWLVIVGGAKVPKKVYQLVDFNISITLQPHSELAGLAIFLNKFYDDYWLGRDIHFPGASIKIIPSPRGKIIIPLNADSPLKP
ncbi:MAG: tRNA (cytidine(56)-2'-O)-methyltransferase [Candidatus Hermodarchaeota archaeon]